MSQFHCAKPFDASTSLSLSSKQFSVISSSSIVVEAEDEEIFGTGTNNDEELNYKELFNYMKLDEGHYINMNMTETNNNYCDKSKSKSTGN